MLDRIVLLLLYQYFVTIEDRFRNRRLIDVYRQIRFVVARVVRDFEESIYALFDYLTLCIGLLQTLFVYCLLY